MAACCYWQSIFAQRFGDILGNTFRKTDLNESITGVKNITDETAVAAQKAAMLAVKNMYEITNIDSFDIYMQLPSEHIYYKNHLLSYNYNRPAGNVIIPDGIIAVTRAAFNDCEEITSVSLPKTIRHIGNYAFKDCKALTAITIPVSQENVFKIDSSVFMNVDKSKVTLYVPYGTSDTYASIEGWSEFKNISELAPEIFNLEIPDYGYTTLYLDYSVRIPDGVEAFVVNAIDNGCVELEYVPNIIPSHTAVLIKATPGEHQFVQTIDEPPFIEQNLLKGTLENEFINTEDGAYFVLANGEDGIGFYPPLWNTVNSFENSANRAYLFIKNGQQNSHYRLDYDYVNDIVDIKISDTNYSIFDAAGRRVKNPSRGFYIINGKKTFYK